MRIAPRSLLLLLSLAVLVVGCQVTGGHSTLTGNWTTITSGTNSLAVPLAFTFTMTEGSMVATPGSAAPLTITNISFTGGAGTGTGTNGSPNNCFDNNATMSGSVMSAGSAGAGNRTANFTMSENGNVATFNLTVASDNNSASGSFVLTGGNVIGTSATACPASDTGTATFTRQQ